MGGTEEICCDYISIGVAPAVRSPDDGRFATALAGATALLHTATPVAAAGNTAIC